MFTRQFPRIVALEENGTAEPDGAGWGGSYQSCRGTREESAAGHALHDQILHHARPSLYRDSDLDDLLLDGVLHQLRLVVDVQFAHQVELMGLYRLDAEVQVVGDLLDGVAFSEHLQN